MNPSTSLPRKIIFLLDRRERWKLGLLLALATVSGVSQVGGVGSVMPFVAVLTNPGIVQENTQLQWFHHLLGSPSTSVFLTILGASVLVTFFLSNALIAFTMWLTFKFARWNQYRLSRRLLEAYLNKPYIYHLQHNSADAGKNILTEAEVFGQQVVVPGLQAAAFGVAALFIASFLVWLSPGVAIMALGIIGGAYGLVYLAVRQRLNRVGRQRLRANTAQFKAANEAFGAIKEVKAASLEGAFLARYDPEARLFARSQAVQQMLGILPRYLIEVLGIGSVLLIILVLVAFGQEYGAVIPLVSVYAIAGYRLFPAFQHIFFGASLIRANTPLVDALYSDLYASSTTLVQAGIDTARSDEEASSKSTRVSTALPIAYSGRLPFRQAIELRNVTFTYPGRESPALRGVSLTIPRGASVAFVGETGSGKTTLADVMLGLLQPEAGAVLVDGVELTYANLRCWQDNIGYVPQNIYLADDTVEANIAFGVPEGVVDRNAVERAARVANIHDFVINHLPHGYGTFVGEQGISLSGGQRQRIGIARALYRDPEVLVLDEATSALDNATEDSVQKAIDQAAEAKTLIIIAHRISTVRQCDVLFFLEHGEVSARGPYNELVMTNDSFRLIVRQAAH